MRNSPTIRNATFADFIARYGIFLILLVMVVFMTIATPIIRDGRQLFLTTNNIIQVIQQGAINAVIAVGMTYVITSGGIDLSVGSIVAFVSVITALVLRDNSFVVGGVDFNVIVGILVALGAGALCGLFNGFLITVINLPPFIATLGTLGMFRGLALVISEGQSIYGFNQDFVVALSYRYQIGSVGLPVAVVIAVLVAIVFWFFLTFTKFGKYTIAIGGNEQTTRLVGIRVNRYKLGIYMLSGLLSGLGAAMLLGRLRSGDPTFGALFELDAIAAAVMGGTSLSGGEGSITGTIVGALIISLVQNAMNLYNVPSYWQQFIIGTVIVLAVMLDQYRRRTAQRV